MRKLFLLLWVVTAGAERAGPKSRIKSTDLLLDSRFRPKAACPLGPSCNHPKKEKEFSHTAYPLSGCRPAFVIQAERRGDETRRERGRAPQSKPEARPPHNMNMDGAWCGLRLRWCHHCQRRGKLNRLTSNAKPLENLLSSQTQAVLKSRGKKEIIFCCGNFRPIFTWVPSAAT